MNEKPVETDCSMVEMMELMDQTPKPFDWEKQLNESFDYELRDRWHRPFNQYDGVQFED